VSCGDFVALSLGAGAHGVDCNYDTSAHLLVGAMDVNDTSTFCGNSFTKTAGQVPSLACRFPVAMPTLYRLCTGKLNPDAGAD
jgi:hypothetical protein